MERITVVARCPSTPPLSEYNFDVREDFRGEGPKSQERNQETQEEEVKK
jgi:hypothetical protein